MFGRYENKKVQSLFVYYKFIDMLKAQYKSRKSPSNQDLKQKAKEMEQGMALLCLFESFLESAPQVILQLSILTLTGIDTRTFKGEIY